MSDAAGRERSARDKRAPLSASQRWIIVAIGTLLVLLADQLSKLWALRSLEIGDPIDVIWTLRLNLAFNSGMAFSRGSGSGRIIGVVAIAIAVVLLLVARKLTSRVQLALVGLVIGGALGNVIDRVTRVGELGSIGSGFMSGSVVDFIDLQWWPIFNVADAAIVVGGLALAFTGFKDVDADSVPGGDETAANVESSADTGATVHAESAADHGSTADTRADVDADPDDV